MIKSYIKILIISLLFSISLSFPIKARAVIPVYVVSGQLQTIKSIGTTRSGENVNRVGIMEELYGISKVREVQMINNLGNIQNIQMNTDLEFSLETFLIDLFTTFAIREEGFLQTLELAKIEKAREDVNKLTFETQRELTGQGIIVEVPDPVTGKNYTIKKEGRIITNPDDFLFEEPIQKARDFVYCYLAPWKHFPLENDNQFCDSLELDDSKPEKTCNTSNVCALMPEKTPYGVTQCSSDMVRDQIKQRLLNSLVRKEHKWALAPPESWYTPAICERVLNSFTCVDQNNCFGVRKKNNSEFCEPSDNDKNCIPEFCELSDNGNCGIVPSDNLPIEQKAQINNTHASLAQSVAYTKTNVFNLMQAAGNPNNNPSALEQHLKQRIDAIISEHQTLRQAQYTAGQGIRPEKYLIAFTDQSRNCKRYYSLTTGEIEVGEDCKAMDERFFGRPLTMNHGDENKSYKNSLFWFDTENITSPAVVLLQKMAATAQAQFDLARQGFRYPAFQSETATSFISSAGLGFSEAPIILRLPTIRNLPSPWLDDNFYAELPKDYSNDTVGNWPPEIGENFYLNRWYKDVIQVYLPQPQTAFTIDEMEGKTFSKILAQWFCEEGPPGGKGNWACLGERRPKSYPPNIEDIQP